MNAAKHRAMLRRAVVLPIFVAAWLASCGVPSRADSAPPMTAAERQAEPANLDAAQAMRTRDYARMRDDLTKVLAVPGLSDGDVYFALRDRANAAYHLHDYPSARTDLTAALKLRPDSSKAWVMLATIDDRMKKYDASAADFAQAGRVDATLAPNLALDALKLYRADQLVDAFSEARAASQADVSEPLARTLLCEIASEAFPRKDALRLCDAAAAVPKLSPEMKHTVYSARGFAKAGLGDADGAKTDLALALTFVPKPAWRDLTDRGYAELQTQDYRAAIADLRASIAMNAGSGFTHIALATALGASGDLKGARTEFETAESVDPRSKAYDDKRIAMIDAAFAPKAAAPTSGRPASSNYTGSNEQTEFEENERQADLSRGAYENGVAQSEQMQEMVQTYEQSFEPPPSGE